MKSLLTCGCASTLNSSALLLFKVEMAIIIVIIFGNVSWVLIHLPPSPVKPKYFHSTTTKKINNLPFGGGYVMDSFDDNHRIVYSSLNCKSRLHTRWSIMMMVYIAQVPNEGRKKKPFSMTGYDDQRCRAAYRFAATYYDYNIIFQGRKICTLLNGMEKTVEKWEIEKALNT